jgi:hypothetical protein
MLVYEDAAMGSVAIDLIAPPTAGPVVKLNPR